MARNIVLVTIDSLRADHCGFHDPPPAGWDWDGSLTPTLDSMAEVGVVFENAIAPGPRTPSSMPTIATGEPAHAADLGAYGSWTEKQEHWLQRRGRIRRLLTRHATFAERLHDRGYATGAVTANPWTDRDTGFDRGFDEFTTVYDVDPTGLAGALARRLPGIDQDRWPVRWPDFYEQVIHTREALTEPYFLWVFLLDPHQPYFPPRRHRKEVTLPGMLYATLRYNRLHAFTDDLPAHLDGRLRGAYRDAVRSADAFLDRLVGDLTTEDPAVVVHADHGEAFGEHGVYGHRPQLYEENIHVPFVVWNANEEANVPEPVTLRHLPRLLGEIADGTFTPDGYGAPFVTAATEEGERRAVRGRTWKLIRGGEEWPYVRSSSGEELYHLLTDPGEQTDLIDDRADAATALRVLIDRHESDLAERATVARAAGQATDVTRL